jgi:solute carrier family 8 (sodium/calcium exchanger)
MKYDPYRQEFIQTKVNVWNPTVANLTLMALGSSAPEILLNVIETVSALGSKPGELGPSTIVGSAAFNFLVISGISIYAVNESNDERT